MCSGSQVLGGKLQCREFMTGYCFHRSIRDAQAIVETWRMDYNTVRSPSPVGNRTPEEAVTDQEPVTAGLS